MPESRNSVVQFNVTNRSPVRVNLVLEPTGEIYALEPDQTRIVKYAGDPQPRVSIDFGENEIKLWEEGPGSLTVDDDS
jgi:hypothetical protein